MKICFVHSFRVENEEHLGFLCNIPSRTKKLLGENAEVIFMYEGKKYNSNLFDDDIKLINYGMASNSYLIRVINKVIMPFKLYRFCKSNGIDIVMNLSNHHSFFMICWSGKFGGAKGIARVVGGIPYVGPMPLTRKIKKKAYLYLEKISLKTADRVYCISDSLKRRLEQNGSGGANIEVISPGIDTRYFQPKKLDEVMKRPKRFLFVGRIVKRKGIEEAIQAFIKAKKEFPDLEFDIYGRGDDFDSLYEKYGGLDGVNFKGYVSMRELPNIYYYSDIFLFLSHYEGLGNVILEAMASMVPIIATDVDELSSMIDNERGILVAPGEVDQATAAIIKMVSNKDFRVDCACKAYDYVVKKHSFDNVRDKTLSFFKSVLSEVPK